MLQRAFSCLMDVFSESCLREGMKYVKLDGMLSVRLSDGLLHARIKGSMGRLFDVYIDLKTWPTSVSRCLCDAHYNCEHAAASLLALRLKAMGNAKSAVGLERLDRWIEAYQHIELLEEIPTQTHRLFYYLEFTATSFTVQLAVSRILKKGGVGKKTYLEGIHQVKLSYRGPEDAEILALLAREDGVGICSNRTALLTLLLNSGRALDEEMELPWQLGPSKTASIAWLVEKEGTQHWVINSQHKQVTPCILDKFWYVDATQLEAGLIELPYREASIQFLCEQTRISPEQLPEKLAEFTLQAPDLPQPLSLAASKTRTSRPQFVVVLDVLPADGRKPSCGTMTLEFEYEGCRVRSQDPIRFVYKQQGDKLSKISRDFDFERACTEQCYHAFPLHPQGFDLTQREDLHRIQTEFIPWVEQQKGRVVLNHPIYARVLDEEALEWYGQLENQGDFFAYELGILVEGKKLNLVPILLQLFAQYQLSEWESFEQDHVFRLHVGDNQILPMTLRRIKPFIDFLLFEGNKYHTDEKAFKLKRYQLIMMQESLNALSASLRRQWSEESLMTQLRQLLEKQTLPTTILPKEFLATLRDYQQQGLDWLQALRACGFGGILADDMGLGKTVQTLAHLMVEKCEGRMTHPSLIIAPLSLVGNWQAEVLRFAPALKTLIYHGTDRQTHVFDEYDLVISTYGLVHRDKLVFLKQHFYYLILDEAQWIKNARAQTTLMIQQVQASFRLCLSGTPFENHLGELWSLFHFIMPGILVERAKFKLHFQDPIEKHGDFKKKEALMKRIQPFLLRRTKQQVAQELPEKTIMVRNVDLMDAQRDLYELIRLSMEKRVRDSIARYGLVKSQMIFLDALLKLRQVCCDPRLLSLPMAKSAHGVSAKLDSLMELLEPLVEEGRRILLFSQFTSMLTIIEEMVKAKGYSYLKLTGQTRDRQLIVNEFQEGNTSLFLMSLKAGGVGLNLTKADTVIHYDPWWNPAVEEQATDRTHRLGQSNPVFVYRLVATGTVEDAMMVMQAKKRALFEGMLSEQQMSSTRLTEEDLALFFQPLS